MRLVGALFLVTLLLAMTTSIGFADDPKPADPKPEVSKKKVPLRVVKIMPETRQVLFFDKTHGNHVVAEVGETVEGYVVDDIDDEEVTLTSDAGTQVILAAPPARPAQPAHKEKTAEKKAEQAPATPVDPYASSDAAASEGTSAPVDPYAEPSGANAGALGSMTRGPAAPKTPGEGGVRVTSAGDATAEPADPYGDAGIAAFAEAVGAPAQPATTSPAKGKAKPPAKPTRTVSAKTGKPVEAGPSAAAHSGNPSDAAALATAATGSAPPTTAAASGTIIARSELDAALGDFGKLAAAFRGSFTPEGLRVDALADGTILTKVGLQKGDVITAVDNRPLRSLDDAASLYARAGSVRSTTIQLVRAGKPLTLRVTIQ